VLGRVASLEGWGSPFDGPPLWTRVVRDMITAMTIPTRRIKSLSENFIFTSTKCTKPGATLEIDHFAVN